MHIGPHASQGVIVGEYSYYQPGQPTPTHPGGVISDGDSEDKNRVIGWLEPACSQPSWILWFTQQGDAVIYTEREAGGAVVGEPIRIKARDGNPSERDLRTAVHNYFNSPDPENENKLRALMYGEAPTRARRDAVFYGPHACDKCAVLICKMGREYGSEAYTYPEPPIYPNTIWVPHVCQQRDVERVNGLRSLGWRAPGDIDNIAPESPEPTDTDYRAARE